MALKKIYPALRSKNMPTIITNGNKRTLEIGQIITIKHEMD